jgi:hypothetical protein
VCFNGRLKGELYLYLYLLPFSCVSCNIRFLLLAPFACVLSSCCLSARNTTIGIPIPLQVWPSCQQKGMWWKFCLTLSHHKTCIMSHGGEFVYKLSFSYLWHVFCFSRTYESWSLSDGSGGLATSSVLKLIHNFVIVVHAGFDLCQGYKKFLLKTIYFLGREGIDNPSCWL